MFTSVCLCCADEVPVETPYIVARRPPGSPEETQAAHVLANRTRMVGHWVRWWLHEGPNALKVRPVCRVWRKH